ncbi:hypothetical protein N9496_05080 [Akkermansiaceae bacterium]|nr:hypothetical protein [Akkermansiaceae bacterium]
MLYPKLRRIWLTRKHSAPPCPYGGIPFHLQLPRYGQLKLELYTKTADAVGQPRTKNPDLFTYWRYS